MSFFRPVASPRVGDLRLNYRPSNNRGSKSLVNGRCFSKADRSTELVFMNEDVAANVGMVYRRNDHLKEGWR